MLVQGQVGYQRLQQLPELSEVTQPQSGIPLAASCRTPAVTHLAADVTDLLAGCCLPQSIHNLLLRMTFSWHACLLWLPSKGPHSCRCFQLSPTSFLGLGQLNDCASECEVRCSVLNRKRFSGSASTKLRDNLLSCAVSTCSLHHKSAATRRAAVSHIWFAVQTIDLKHQ